MSCPGPLSVGGSLRQPGKGPARKVSSRRKVALPQLRVFLKRLRSPLILRGSRERPPSGCMRPAGHAVCGVGQEENGPVARESRSWSVDLPWSHASGGSRVEPPGGVDRRCVGGSRSTRTFGGRSRTLSAFRATRASGIAPLWAGWDGLRESSGSSANSQIPPSRCLSEGPSRHPPGSEAPEFGCPTSRDEGKGMGGSP
jgi:hypothetical protein